MKRLLALALALVMIFCLAACGEDKKSDDNKDNNTTAATTTTPTTPADPSDPTNPGATGDGVKVGLSVADLDALLQPLLNGDAGTDVENLYLEMGASEEAMILALGAKLFGEQIDANLFVGEDIVVSAPALLDKNYGISMENLVSLLKDLIASSGAEMPEIDPQVVIDLVSKYYTMLIDEISAVDTITATEADGTVILSGSMDSDDIAAIVVNIIEAACADDEFFSLMGTLSGMSADEFKQNFLSGKPSKDVLLSQMQEMLSGFGIDIQIDSLVLYVGLPIEADMTISLNLPMEDTVAPAVLDMAYSLVTMECDISVQMAGSEIISLTMGNGNVEMLMNMGGMSMEAKISMTDTGITGYMKQNGVELMSFAFNITANGFAASVTSNGETMSLELAVTDNSITLTLNMRGSVMVLNAKVTDTGAEGSLKMDGVEMGKIVFTKKVEGTKISYTLATLSIQGTEIDFSKGGLSLYIDTAAAVPAVPEYTDITTLSNDELTAIMDKFVTDNAELVEILSGLFGSMGGSAEGEYSVKVDVAA